MKTANAVISCQDRPGIVRAVTDFLFQNKTNISYLEQHIENKHFFMRVEWQIQDQTALNNKNFSAKFIAIQKEFDMEVKADFNERKKRVGLFCSRELHCLIDILSRVSIAELKIEVPFIQSNFLDAKDIATKFEIPFYHVPSDGNYEEKQLEIIKKHPVDLLGLARYMKILSRNFITQIGENRIINVHHSFLPSFIGHDPYEQAHSRGVKLIGATSHFVTAELDQGPIIEQNVKRINHNYNVTDLKLLGREAEKDVFAFAIKKYLENKLICYKNRVIVFS